MGAVGDLSFTLGFPTVLDTKFYDSGGLSAFTNASTQLVKSSSRMDSQSLNAIVDIIIALEANIGLNAQDIYVDIAARLDAMTAAIGTSWDAEMSQDAIGTILVDTATIDLIYTDGTPSIVANVVTNSIGPSQLAQFTGSSLLGNPTGSTANASAITLATGLRFVASTLDLAVNSLTADGSPDAANDYVVTWDASAATHKKVLLNLIGGALTGGAANKLAIWTSGSALTNDADLHYDSTNNNLGIGTSTFGTNLKYGIALSHDGTNYLSTSVTDVVQLYAKDQTGSTALNLFTRGEDGGITSIGTRVIVGNAGALLSNGVAAGGVQLDGVGPHLQLSNVASIAHGATGGGVATSTFFDVRPISSTDGGVQMRGFTETNLATIISCVVVTDPVTTKSTSSDAALRFEFGKKFISTPEAMNTGVNLVVFSDAFAGGLGSRWILDNDGDTWQTGSITLDGSITTGGNVARSLTVNRHTTSNTAGNNFTIESGGATVAATNKVGGNVILKTGIGTGSAVPSTLQVQAPNFSGTTGTTSQTLVNRWLLNGTADLTSGVASTLITIPLATLQMAGGGIEYSIDASDGADMINLSGYVTFSAVNKGAAYTTNSSILGTEAVAKSDITDTIITAFSFNNGSNQTQLQITVTLTGITASTFKIMYDVFSASQQNITLN